MASIVSLRKGGYRTLARCPDCDGPAITPGLDLGDGNCNWCHGTGESILGALASTLNIFDPERTAAKCTRCDGTGVCPTCDGLGEVEGESSFSTYSEEEESHGEGSFSKDVESHSEGDGATYEYGGYSSTARSEGSGLKAIGVVVLVIIGIWGAVRLSDNQHSRQEVKVQNQMEAAREVCPGDEIRLGPGEEVTLRFGERPGCVVERFKLEHGTVLSRWIYPGGRVDENIWRSTDASSHLAERPSALYLRATEPALFKILQQRVETKDVEQGVRPLERRELCPGTEARLALNQEILFEIRREPSCYTLFVQLEMGEVLSHWYYTDAPQDVPPEQSLSSWKATDRTFNHTERPVALYLKAVRPSILRPRGEDWVTQWYTSITPGWHQIEPGEVVMIFNSQYNGPRFVPYSNRAFWEAREEASR